MNSGAGVFSWPQVLRLGLVQASLGAVVVLTTSTLNRVMVVELGLPALLPGLLVALHYLVQVLRPRMGHGADVGRRNTPWIVGGVAVLGVGGLLAAMATGLMAQHRGGGIALAVLAFVLIGVGVSAAGTSLLALMAKRVAPLRRAGAATTVWLMMIVGFILTTAVVGRLLDPYTPLRLVAITGGVSLLALLLTVVATWGLEGLRVAPPVDAMPPGQRVAAVTRADFMTSLAEAWADPKARRFTFFVFVSMLAYSAQDLILEPFAGSVRGFTPGESTRLSSLQHGGALLGMLAAAMAGRGRGFGSLRTWQVGGCGLSALALVALSATALGGAAWPFTAIVFLLGVANGAFSIAAIASMMALAGEGRASREGVRMGLWGAAQALAFALGGLVGTGASDLAQWWLGAPAPAYAAVFVFEALLFCAAARLAWSAPTRSQPRLDAGPRPSTSTSTSTSPAFAGLEGRG